MKRSKKNNKNVDESEAYIKKKNRSYKKSSRKKDRTVLKDVSRGKIDYDDYMEKMEDQF